MTRQSLPPCLLCGGPASVCRIYFAADAVARRCGVPLGDELAIAFSLCRRCRQEPGALDRATIQLVDNAVERARETAETN